MALPIIMVLLSPLSLLRVKEWFSIFIPFFDEIPLSTQNSPRLDAAFFGVTSGAAMLFAYVPLKDRQTDFLHVFETNIFSAGND